MERAYNFPSKWNVSRNRMYDLIKLNYLKNRVVVSNDQSKFSEYLKKIFKGNILKFRPGTKHLSWTIPKNWNVKKAYIKDLRGKTIADFSDNPLHLWSYSKSIKKKISIDELKKHLSTDPERPDEFGYHYTLSFTQNYSNWGFSIPYNQLKKMNDKYYNVCVDSSLDNKNYMNIVSKSIKGKSKNTILIMAHTCHPGIVSDGLACIAVAFELYNILKRKNNYYTYEFLFGPEYYTAAAYIKKKRNSLKNIKCGIFLDALGNHEMMTLQRSFKANTEIDQVFENIYNSHLYDFKIRNFKEDNDKSIIGNDELFYNYPNVNIPTIGVGRNMYREYHLNSDNLENLSLYNLEQSVWILYRSLLALEKNKKFKLNYLGSLNRNEFNKERLNIKSPREWRTIEKVLMLADGKNSILDISNKLNMDFYYVENIFNSLPKKSFSVIKRL